MHSPSPTGSPVCTGNEHFRKLNVWHCVLCSELHFPCASMDLGPIPVGKGLLFGSSRPPPGTLGFLRGHGTAAGTTAHMPTGSKPSKKREPPGAAAVIHQFHWLEMEPGVPEAHTQHPQKSLLLLVFRGGKGGRECRIVTQGDGGTKCLLQLLSLWAFSLSSSSSTLKNLSRLLTSHPLGWPLSKEKQNKKCQ